MKELDNPDKKIEAYKIYLKENYKTYEELLNNAASAMTYFDLMEELNNDLIEELKTTSKQIYQNTSVIETFQQLQKLKEEKEEKESFGKMVRLSIIATKEGMAYESKQRARHAANARHSKPGGSREKQEKIRAIWATGKYTTRERCAEEEYDALGISFTTARKALRNTPSPKKRS